MRPIKAEKADILCLHSVFSENIAEAIEKDAFYLTIVREPLSMMRSFYIYQNWKGCSKKTLKEIITGFPHQTVICNVNAYNPMMFDLGFSVDKHSTSPKAIDEYIEMLDKRFNLVMIVEYFDESLIILRDMLGWSNDDILSFAVNFRKKTNDSFGEVAMEGVDMSDDEESKAFLYEKSIADAKLYYHFKRKLETTIEANKAYITKEKVKLQTVKQRWMKFCIKNVLPNELLRDQRFEGKGYFFYGYALSEEGLKNQTCIDLATSEHWFVKRLNQYQNFGAAEMP
ncbi:GAL3ST3 [Bugula neritina]|uniref:GAL3ST3 n=1 Tax=Bugula neritina TaxID=10212 RepID=A0A7J7JPS6_BUGNE|nr:GAL3ST3 [Bugula neritina]